MELSPDVEALPGAGIYRRPRRSRTDASHVLQFASFSEAALHVRTLEPQASTVKKWDLSVAEDRMSFLKLMCGESLKLAWVKPAGRRASDILKMLVGACENQHKQNKKYTPVGVGCEGKGMLQELAGDARGYELWVKNQGLVTNWRMPGAPDPGGLGWDVGEGFRGSRDAPGVCRPSKGKILSAR